MKLKKFNELNEQFMNNNNEFKTEISKNDVEFTSELDKNTYDMCNIKSCYVYWTYEMEVRKFGIKGIIPSIHRVVLEVEYEMFIENEEDTYDEPKIYEYDIHDNIDFEYLNDIPTIPYHPMEIEIDEKSKKIMVKF